MVNESIDYKNILGTLSTDDERDDDDELEVVEAT